jgi:hypothetical protein
MSCKSNTNKAVAEVLRKRWQQEKNTAVFDSKSLVYEAVMYGYSLSLAG